MITRTVEVPPHERFQTFCIGCSEVVQIPFDSWEDQAAALRWAIARRLIIWCPNCNTLVELDMPRAA